MMHTAVFYIAVANLLLGVGWLLVLAWYRLRGRQP
jgi:hypothetical protein